MSAAATDLSRIEAKLDTVIRLLALDVASDNDSLQERALRLRRAGLSPKEIAVLCGTTPNTVSVSLSSAKRQPRRPKKRTAK